MGLVLATTQTFGTDAIGLETLSTHGKLPSSGHIQGSKGSLVIREPGVVYAGPLTSMASPYIGAQLGLALSAFAGRCTHLRGLQWLLAHRRC